jgi:hypothetical protein
VHTENGIEAICNTNDIDEVNKNLPLELPDVPDFSPTSDGTSLSKEIPSG